MTGTIYRSTIVPSRTFCIVSNALLTRTLWCNILVVPYSKKYYPILSFTSFSGITVFNFKFIFIFFRLVLDNQKQRLVCGIFFPIRCMLSKTYMQKLELIMQVGVNYSFPGQFLLVPVIQVMQSYIIWY